MLISNTSDRLQYLMNVRNLKQIDILNKCLPICEKYNVKMGRNHISQYVSGKVKPNQEKLSILAIALDVNEAWLMGYDVPMNNETSNISITKHKSFVEVIGSRISYIRHKRGMTVEELANKVGITPLQLEDMENGVNREFNSDLMKRFCEVLNVQNSYFIYMLEPVDNLGDNIKTLREINELTESEVASELSISVDQLKRYESGTENIPYDTLDKLADFFNVDVTMLLGMNFKSRANEPRFITSLRILERTKQWNEIVGLSTFSDEEMQELMNYAKFIISKRKNEQK